MSERDLIAQNELELDYSQLDEREKEWVRDEIDNLYK